MYTDGLDDNVYPEDMPDCIENQMSNGLVTSLSNAADCLAKKAYWFGKDENYKSPFKRDHEYTVINNLPISKPPADDETFMGGKKDDITVTVAQIFASKPADDDSGFKEEPKENVS